MSAPATEKGDISDFVQHDGNPTTLSDKLEEARTFVYSADKLYQTYIEKGHTLTRHGIPGFHNAAHALCYKLGLIPQQSFFDPVDPSPDHWALLLVSHSIRVPSDAELLSCSRSANANTPGSPGYTPYDPVFSPPPPTPATDPNPFSFGDNLRYALVHEDIVALGQRLC